MITKDLNQKINIGIYEYYPRCLLGKGTTGNVYQGLHIEQQRKVAIKAVKWNQNDSVNLILLQNEIKALSKVNHINVLKMQKIIKNDEGCYIVTQKYNRGTLKQYIQKQGHLETQQALNIFRGIIQGYISIAENGILHRDLKPANIMLKDNLQPVIIDFGYSAIIVAHKTMTTFNVGSPSYMSPEAYQKTLYSEKSDIWALGMILYEMLKGKTMDHQTQNIKEFYSQIKQKGCSFTNDKISTIAAEIIRNTIIYDPQKRISCHKIKYLLDKDVINKLKDKKINDSKNNNQFYKFRTQHQIMPQQQKNKIKIQQLQSKVNFQKQKKQQNQVLQRHSNAHIQINLLSTPLKFGNNHSRFNLKPNSQIKQIDNLKNKQKLIQNNSCSQLNVFFAGSQQTSCKKLPLYGSYQTNFKMKTGTPMFSKFTSEKHKITPQHTQFKRPLVKFDQINSCRLSNNPQMLAHRHKIQCQTPNPRNSEYKFPNNWQQNKNCTQIPSRFNSQRII